MTRLSEALDKKTKSFQKKIVAFPHNARRLTITFLQDGRQPRKNYCSPTCMGISIIRITTWPRRFLRSAYVPAYQSKHSVPQRRNYIFTPERQQKIVGASRCMPSFTSMNETRRKRRLMFQQKSTLYNPTGQGAPARVGDGRGDRWGSQELCSGARRKHERNLRKFSVCVFNIYMCVCTRIQVRYDERHPSPRPRRNNT